MANRLDFCTVSLKTYILTSVAIPGSCIATFYIFQSIGLDPQWSISMATKHCLKKEWIHLDTTLFNAVYRDAGSILGKELSNTNVQSEKVVSPEFRCSDLELLPLNSDVLS